MPRRSLVLISLGVVALVVAALTRFVILPAGSKLPGNTKVDAGYSGTATLLNAEALKSGDTAHALLSGVPITIKRHIQVASTRGDTAVVHDDFTMSGPHGLKSVDPHVYAVDRTSLAGAQRTAGATVEPATGGLTIAWPLHPDKASAYKAYDTATQTVVPATSTGSGTLNGRSTLSYAYTATGVLRDPALVKALPPALPKALAEALAPVLPADVAAQLGPALASLPDPIPLTYTADTDVSAKVDKVTGLPLDESIDQKVVASVEVGGKSVDLLPVLATKADLTKASISDAVAKAKHVQLLLTALGVVAPLVLVVVGLVLVVVGWRRRAKA